MNSLHAVTTLLTLAAAPGLGAQGTPALLRDLNQLPITRTPDSSPRVLTTVGEWTFFTATVAGIGNELWRTDGTPGGTSLVLDIEPGATSSNPAAGTELDGQILFLAGQEIWRSDGTSAGTVEVVGPAEDVRPESPSLCRLGGAVFFAASSATRGTGLWRSDGTRAGTWLVHALERDPQSRALVLDCVAAAAQVFFLAYDSTHGLELWRSDGTAAGTRLAADIRPGPASAFAGFIWELVPWGNEVWFTADDGANGVELWRSDGSAAGTALVRDVQAGPLGSYPRELTSAGASFFFVADDGVVGAELWRSDGSESGTVLVKAIDPRTRHDTGPDGLTAVGSTVWFRVDDGTHGPEPWRSDGTAAGTAMVVDLVAGSRGSSTGAFVTSGGLVFFTASFSSWTNALWRSDGTAAGTRLCFDPVEPGAPHQMAGLVAAPGGILFVGDVSAPIWTGRELWFSDGTAAGTVLLGDLNPWFSDSRPRWFATDGVAHAAYFSAIDGLSPGLWRTDGTTAGTTLIRTFYSFDAFPGTAVQLGRLGLFVANDGVHGHELWHTDGTVAGTALVRDFSPGPLGVGPGPLTPARGTMFLAAENAALGRELWKTDGTSAGTVLVADILPGWDASYPLHLTALGDRVVFTARTLTAGREPWVSDGTAQGTVLLADVAPGPAESNVSNFTRVGGLLFFSAFAPGTGTEPWVTDGTPAGTRLVLDVEPGPASSFPSYLADVDGVLFFQTWHATRGSAVWRSDGTASGTRMVAQLPVPSFAGGSIAPASLRGNYLFFLEHTGAGAELWRSDGTAAGTGPVADLNPGSRSGLPRLEAFIQVLPGGDRALLAASDGVHGVEPWVTDGTAQGTVMVADLVPGPFGSNPGRAALVGCRLVFAANDRVVGEEPWAMESMALAAAFGTGCPGTGGRVPALSGFGDAPVLGNARFALRVTSALPGANAVVLIGAAGAALPLGSGCSAWLDLNAVMFFPVTTIDAGGAGLVPFPIPYDPALRCTALFAQAWVADPGGAWFDLFAASNGLELVLNDR